MQVPLDANLIKGSHGYNWHPDESQGIMMTTLATEENKITDTDVYDFVMNHFS